MQYSHEIVDNTSLQTGWYDGHRVNEDGDIVFLRQAVADLMKRFPEIDRHARGTPFQTSHGVWVGSSGRQGRNKLTGMIIDGGPLAHPALDHVPGIGRMSLANSANFKTKNM